MHQIVGAQGGNMQLFRRFGLCSASGFGLALGIGVRLGLGLGLEFGMVMVMIFLLELCQPKVPEGTQPR